MERLCETAEKFEELFGNTPFENIEKIKNHIKDNYIHKDKIREVIKKHEEARDIAGEQLTTRVVVADSDSLNYGRIQAHNVAIKDLQELLEE